MNRFTRFILALSLPALAAQAALAGEVAAQIQPADSTRLYHLDALVVTATRSQVARGVIPQKVELVDADAIQRIGAHNAAEALRASTPVDVIEFPGLLTGVSVRGFRPQYTGISLRTLILVDGRPAGTSNLSLLHSGTVDRIEVLRGPASALYGSNAMGGVINLITRRTSGPATGSATVGYGSFGAYRVQASAGGRLAGSLDFDLSFASVGQRDGYDVGSNRTFAPDSLTKTHPDGTTSRLPWVTSDSTLAFTRYASRSGSLRLGYTVADGWRIDLSGETYRAYDVQNPGDLNVTTYDSRSLKDIGRGSADFSVTGASGRHSPFARAFAAREIIDYYDAPVPPTFVSFRTPVRTVGFQLQDAIELGTYGLTAGIDFTAAESRSEAYSEDGERRAPFNPDVAIRSSAAFVQARANLLGGRLATTASARVDRVVFDVLATPELPEYPANSERHLVLTPSAGMRYTLLPGFQVYGNVGRGFVAPDAFYVAGYHEVSAGPDRDAVFVTRGNPELRPETSLGFDAGITFARPSAGIDLDVGYFRNDVRDRIMTQLTPAADGQLTADGDTILSVTTYVNADEALSSGIEARIGWEVAPLLGIGGSVRLFANGTRMLEAREHVTTQAAWTRTRNVADLTLVAGIDFADLGPLSGRISGRYVGERIDSDYVDYLEPGEILYPAYLVIDLSTSLRVNERLRVGLTAKNLADEDYFEVRGYNLPGRSIGVDLQASF